MARSKNIAARRTQKPGFFEKPGFFHVADFSERAILMRAPSLVVLACVLPLITHNLARADEEAKDSPRQADQSAPTADDEQKVRFERFSETLSNAALVGHFTITGKPNQPLHEERYEIKGVSKVGSGDVWLFNARIKYGEHDVTLPLPLPVKWADKTPVITLDNVTVPYLGTFDARVVIDGDRYAGTWRHGDVGGHLFGVIEKIETGPKEKTPTD